MSSEVDTARPAAGEGGTFRRAARERRFQAGVLLTLVVVGVAVAGPLIAPHEASDLVGAPYDAPSGSTMLGTDYLGHDVLSRVLRGGRTVVWMSVAAVSVGMFLGVTTGLIAGYSRSWVGRALMWATDVLLSIPNIVLVLLVVALFGAKPWLLVLLVGIAWWPQVTRVTQAVTRDVATRDFVRAAELMGLRRRRILARELLPNLATPLMIEFGLRLTWSVGLLSALSFLGFGVQPPLADWGLMINENRQGISIQPWAILAPVVLIGTFTVGTSLIAEGIARSAAGHHD